MGKAKNQFLEKRESITLKLIRIGETSDLLNTISISQQIMKCGRNEIESNVLASVIKCSIGLNINLSNIESKILVEDITDKYINDSLEDVHECLKKGRRGNYGKTYGKLNMIIISEWMTMHLDDKAQAREQNEIKKCLSESDLPQFKTIDEYRKWAIQGIKNQKDLDDAKKKFKKERMQGEFNEAKKEIDYHNFKMKYEAKKTKAK